nr:hypothetical protein [Tanacetum cinerariifolium]
AAQQLFEQVPHPPEYVPRDHVPVFVPEFEHPEDLVPAEGEAPTSLLPPGFLSPRIRPLSPRALEAEMNAIGSSLYRSLHPSGTPPWLPISTPSTSCRAGIPKANTPPRNRPLLATPRPGCEVGESSAAAARLQGPAMAHGVEVCTRESSEFCTQHHDAQKDRAAVRAEIEVLRNERLAYEQEGIQTRGALARSEAHCRALEARVGESSAAAARRPGPTMAHGVDCSYVETRLRDTERRMMAALELVNLRVSYQVDVCTRESLEFCTRHHDAQKDRTAVRAEIEVLKSERLAYE